MWTIDTIDWQRPPGVIIRRVVDKLSPGRSFDASDGSNGASTRSDHQTLHGQGYSFNSLRIIKQKAPISWGKIITK